MTTRHVWREDPDGRRFKVSIPEGAPDEHARFGALVGPPDVRDLGLPGDTARRLHDQLIARGLITIADVKRAGGRAALQSALQAAFRVDAGTIWELYVGPHDG